MTINKVFSLIIISSLLVGFLTPVSQVEAISADLPETLVTPASLFYSLETFFEDVGTFFTFGSKNKAERLINLAQERMAELEKVSGDERETESIKNTERIRDRYEKQLEKALELVDKISEPQERAAVLNKASEANNQSLVALNNVSEKENIPARTREIISELSEKTFTRQKESLRKLSDLQPGSSTQATIQSMVSHAKLARGKMKDNILPEQREEVLERINEYQDFLSELQEKDGISDVLSEKLDEAISNLEEVEVNAENLKDREQVQEKINSIINKAVSSHTQALKSFSEENPEKAAEIFSESLANRISSLEKASSTATGSEVVNCQDLTTAQKEQIESWLEENNLNQYGDATGTVYTGGNPLFNEETEETQNRYCYILNNHADWQQSLGEGKGPGNKQSEKAAERTQEYANLGEYISEQARERNQEKVQEKIEDSMQKHIQTLERVRDQVPEQARGSIEKVLERTRQSYEKARQKGPGQSGQEEGEENSEQGQQQGSTDGTSGQGEQGEQEEQGEDGNNQEEATSSQETPGQGSGNQGGQGGPGAGF